MNMKHCALIVLCALAAALVAQQARCLVPEPRISDSTKYSKQDTADYNKKSAAEAYNNKTSPRGDANNINNDNNNNDDDDDDEDNELLNRPTFILGEPYKSLLQTTTRFAVAQTSVTNYVQIDTFMDLLNDTGYMLSKPNILNKAVRASAIVMATLMTLMFFVPPAHWRALTASWRRNSRLLELERYLPNGLNEMGIVQLLNQRSEELLARYELNSEACRQQSVCEAGQLLRCSFPKGSKSIVSFISENFSRPRYRDHQYIGSFLKGFIDRNCAANEEMSQSSTCLSSVIKSLSACPSQDFHPKQQPTTPSSVKPKEHFQTIQAGRA